MWMKVTEVDIDIDSEKGICCNRPSSWGGVVVTETKFSCRFKFNCFSLRIYDQFDGIC